MKQQRFRFRILAMIIFALFILLAVYGGYSVMKYGNRWFSTNRNPRVRAQKQSVIPGDILDRNGVVLATTDADGVRVYQADPEARSAVVHIVGDSQGQVSNSVESFQSGYLYGFHTSFTELFGELISGEQQHGDNVKLTIDSEFCTYIAEKFTSLPNSAGKRGAVVVMNYKTGEVVASVSLPTFDPQNITSATHADAGHPFWNRVTQAQYTPGSTFKTITAAAALDAIKNIQTEEIICHGGLDVDGQAIRDYGLAIHGSLTLRQAYMKSCNNAFAILALSMGDEKLRTTAESFGFNDNFLFRDLVVENSVYPTTNRTKFEIATSGFGQSGITATPLHMCMVAAAVANDGVMMEPRLLYEVTGPSGRQRVSFTSAVYRTAMKPETAAVLKDYMRSVVTGGTGTRAAVSGLTICGKTGTAETTINGEAASNAWFIGFIDDDELPFAIAVVVEDVDDGLGGGSVAAPIAAEAFKYLQQHKELVTNGALREEGTT